MGLGMGLGLANKENAHNHSSRHTADPDQTPDHINLINIGPTIDNRHNWRIVRSITYSRHYDRVMRGLMGQRLRDWTVQINFIVVDYKLSLFP